MTTNTSESIHITATFNAPRALVFKAWTDPDLLARWFGPKGFDFVKSSMDLRPGGMYHYCLRSPGGDEMWGKFVYEDVDAPNRLVYVNSFSDADGNTLRHPMAPTFPIELRNVYTFTEDNGVTTIDMVATPVNPSDDEQATFEMSKNGVRGGMGATLQQLEALLADLQK